MSSSPTNAPPPTIPYTSPPITVVLTVILLLFFFIGFFSIYFCRCFMQNLFYNWHLRHNPSRAPVVGPRAEQVHHGLDPLIISAFPTFTYSSVREYQRENYPLECAICLCEFKDENVLRLLTKCYHVFHQDCIDLWLRSHTSCPCCRSRLDTPIESPEKSPISHNSASMNETRESDSHGDSVAIDINDNNENTDETENKIENHVAIEVDPNSGEDKRTETYKRSKSTGHSISSNNKRLANDDRFKLRLPQDVQVKLIPRHNWTRSCTEFGEYKSKTSSSNAVFDEVTLDRDKDRHNV
ncbi:RING/U-box superfamily protein [Artemisia annua]|uniref:RING-type E3 ubiquitin transferase n=1 Tax=Artemisia annua TaxID=35608 RepID=A0A2U1N0W0_ARTAN|nr:RING/U-box superfamily protein [Artemisia annua]